MLCVMHTELPCCCNALPLKGNVQLVSSQIPSHGSCEAEHYFRIGVEQVDNIKTSDSLWTIKAIWINTSFSVHKSKTQSQSTVCFPPPFVVVLYKSIPVIQAISNKKTHLPSSHICCLQSRCQLSFPQIMDIFQLCW